LSTARCSASIQPPACNRRRRDSNRQIPLATETFNLVETQRHHARARRLAAEGLVELAHREQVGELFRIESIMSRNGFVTY